jgi:hypothetical protein
MYDIKCSYQYGTIDYRDDEEEELIQKKQEVLKKVHEDVIGFECENRITINRKEKLLGLE